MADRFQRSHHPALVQQWLQLGLRFQFGQAGQRGRYLFAAVWLAVEPIVRKCAGSLHHAGRLRARVNVRSYQGHEAVEFLAVLTGYWVLERLLIWAAGRRGVADRRLMSQCRVMR